VTRQVRVASCNSRWRLRRALALLPEDHPQRLTAWLDLADVLREALLRSP
jgi:hypothetical protein